MSEPFDAPTRAPAGQPASEPFDPQPRRAAYKLPLSRPIVTWALLAIIGVVSRKLAGLITRTLCDIDVSLPLLIEDPGNTIYILSHPKTSREGIGADGFRRKSLTISLSGY